MMSRTLAGAALLLAAAAAIAGSPRTEPRFIDAVDLARVIVDGDSVRVLDLREAAEYERLHVPGALNVAFDDVAAAAPPFLTVLYGDDAPRAWRELERTGHREGFVLRGGMHAWLTEVMEPRLAVDATPAETAAFEEAAELSRFFGGTPRTGVPRAELAPAEEDVADAVIRRGC
ncbi:MAG TPA: rhodanese-like domain-containing protein [Longimicrobiales bacterium]|nr:rhodanese-like domain-containing protein [Longimicrobiales bacterium]